MKALNEMATKAEVNAEGGKVLALLIELKEAGYITQDMANRACADLHKNVCARLDELD